LPSHLPGPTRRLPALHRATDAGLSGGPTRRLTGIYDSGGGADQLPESLHRPAFAADVDIGV
jgi:hypothetical protein